LKFLKRLVEEFPDSPLADDALHREAEIYLRLGVALREVPGLPLGTQGTSVGGRSYVPQVGTDRTRCQAAFGGHTEALRKTFGGWKDLIDAEELKKNIRYETFVFIRVTAAAVMKATLRIVS